MLVCGDSFLLLFRAFAKISLEDAKTLGLLGPGRPQPCRRVLAAGHQHRPVLLHNRVNLALDGKVGLTERHMQLMLSSWSAIVSSSSPFFPPVLPPAPIFQLAYTSTPAQQHEAMKRTATDMLFISSDRSSYSDVGLLHTRTTFSDFHSVH